MDRINLVKQIGSEMVDTVYEILESDENKQMAENMAYRVLAICVWLYLIVRVIWHCCPDPLLTQATEHIEDLQEKLDQAEKTIAALHELNEENEETIKDKEEDIDLLKTEVAELKADYLLCRKAAVELINKMSKDHKE